MSQWVTVCYKNYTITSYAFWNGSEHLVQYQLQNNRFVLVCWFVCCVSVMEPCVNVVVCGRCMTLWQRGTTLEQLLSPSGTAGSTLQSVPLMPLERWSLLAQDADTAMWVAVLNTHNTHSHRFTSIWWSGSVSKLMNRTARSPNKKNSNQMQDGEPAL